MIIQKSNFGNTSMIKCGYFDGKYEMPVHMHQFSEIIYVESGEVFITVNGNRTLAKKGVIALIPPFAPHEFETPDNCKIWICVASNDFLTDMVPYNELFLGRDYYVYHPSEVLLAYINGRLINNHQQFVDLNYEVTCYFKALLHAIYYDYIAAVPKSSQGYRADTLFSVVLYIKEHAHENITRESVATALGYHPVYVSRCLNSIYGMNFRKLLNSTRVELAKSLLITSNLRIIDIALECGFSGERSFHRSFLEVTGTTPGEYRKRRKDG